jgi:hypothetical protein
MYVGLPDLDLTFLFYIVSGLQLHVDYFVGLRLLLSELCIRDVNTEYPIWYTHVSYLQDFFVLVKFVQMPLNL